MALRKRNPGAGNATGASEMDQAAKLIFPEDTGHCPEEQQLLADLRREHRRLRFALLSIECIGLAVSKSVLDLETALDMYASLPRLRYQPDEWEADFMARVMADDPPRRKYRRAA